MKKDTEFNKTNDGVWYSKGVPTPMEEMDTQHLKRAAEFTARKQDQYQKQIEIATRKLNQFIVLENQLCDELERRGIIQVAVQTTNGKYKTKFVHHESD